MQSVKLPLFSGSEGDFDVWQKKFRAFARTQSWGPAIKNAESATQSQHESLYTNLILALPENDIATIEEVDEDDPKSGYLAWDALVKHYEDDGIYTCATLLAEMDKEKLETETAVEHLNRLIKLQRKLARAGEKVSDRRIVMHLVKNLGNEYGSITDTWDLSSISLDIVRKDLLQKGKRIESRKAGAAKATAFVAQSEHVQGLEQKVKDLEARLARLQAGSGGNGGNQPTFKCWHCGEVGHRKGACPKRQNNNKTGAAAASANKQDSAIAFPAGAVADSSECEVVQPVASAVHVNPGPLSSDEFQDMLLADSGASHHMTAVRSDFVTYKEFALSDLMWVKGICAHAVGIGTVKVEVVAVDGTVMTAKLHDVLHVPELSRRSSGSYHRLFSLTQARLKGHRVVMEDPTDYLLLHPGSGGGVQVPFLRKVGLIWLAARIVTVPNTTASPVAAVAEAAPKSLWHARLGHVGESCMNDLLKANVDGLGYSATRNLEFCESCAVCKSKVKDISRDPVDTSGLAVFEVLGIDFEGPMGTQSLGGCLYSFSAVCFKSRMILHDSLRSKPEAVQSFRRMLAVVNSFRYKVRRVRLDNDSVLMGSEFQALLDEHSILPELTAPYSHWQHGRVERQWGTLIPMAESMMHQAGLGPEYWALAVAAAVYIRNRVWSSGAGDIPYRLVTGRNPDLSCLRVFGCPAYVHVDRSQRRKLEPRAWKGVFVGYAPDSPAWLVYNPATRRMIRSRNVRFNEHAVISMGEKSSSVELVDADEDGPHACNPDAAESEEDDNDSGEQADETRSPQPTRSSTRERRPPGEWWIAANSSASIESPKEPASYKQALRSPQADEWQAAIRSEYDSLIARKTWKLVPRPAGRKLVDSKWVFKVKRNADGSIARYKARLVARGFTQEHGVDYNETFAPTVKAVSLRVLLALAAYYDWEVEQFDVVTAFLEAGLDEEIYMRQPEGFREVNENGDELVCLLLKALYGLKQAPRNWNKVITAWLIDYGFSQSKVDPCIFVYKKGGDFYILALYVDDNILVGAAGPFIDNFKKAFNDRFEVQFLGPASWLIGISVDRDRNAKTIKLGQQQYVLDMLDRFNMSECNAVSSPMVVGAINDTCKDEDVVGNSVPYQSLIGSLLYASVCTRPDISMAVSHLSRFMSKPSTVHWEQAKRVLRYLKGTADSGLVYGGANSIDLVGYSDADHAGDPLERRSRTGYVFLLNGCAVSWKSQRQESVALSTAEAEYMALSAATQETMFLRQLMADMQQQQTDGTVVYEDNQSCIALAKNSMTTGRSKHIDTRYHFCREKHESGELALRYCATEDMIADVLTKPLATPRHKMLCAKMMGHSE